MRAACTWELEPMRAACTHAQEQGEAAYKKDAYAATADNRRFALDGDYTEFRCGKDFRPLSPKEANGAPAAACISGEGLHTAQITANARAEHAVAA